MPRQLLVPIGRLFRDLEREAEAMLSVWKVQLPTSGGAIRRSVES